VGGFEMDAASPVSLANTCMTAKDSDSYNKFIVTF